MSDQESAASAPDESSGSSTTFCPFCSIHLAFPTGSELIQCPQCSNTLEPASSASNQIRCTGCRCLLAYPPRSLYIQCPKCFNTMDPNQPSPTSVTPDRATSSSTHTQQPRHDLTPAGGEPKKRRDPNMPKAVCNAYMVFCKSRRNELKYENPDLPFGKIGAKLGEIWRNMDLTEKRPYEDRAALDRERYRREMLDYQAGKGGEKRQKLKVADEDDEDDHHATAQHVHHAPKSASHKKVHRPTPRHEELQDDEDDYSNEDDE